jgi:hypothetical protein
MTATRETILQIIGKQPYLELMLADNQDTEDIIEAILNKHEKCGKDYDKFSYLFEGGKLPDICERLFDFCKENLAYFIEPTKSQYVSKASTILGRGYSDCKGYALFCGGVLDSLKRKGKKISWAYRFASYKLMKKKPYHVFIVVFYQGQEIYVDPVFNTFNYRKPAMWVEDYVMTGEAAGISGMVCDKMGTLHALSDGDCSCNKIGATGQQTGQLLEKVSPALAVVPVVGWIAAAGGEVAGLFLSVFGSKYTESTQVRWLTCYYERMVLAIACQSDNTVNAADCTVAQQWASYVLGVPIYDQLRLHTLKGTNPDTAASLNQTYDTRAKNFLLYPDVIQAGVTYAQAYQAAQISDQLSWTAPLGGWAAMTAAPSLVDNSTTAATTATTSLSTLFQNKWVLIGLAAVAALILFSSDKKK